MARTFFAFPDSIIAEPIDSPYMNPEQAAETSNAAAFFAPSISCSRQPVEGSGISGVTVATMIMSRSIGSTPASASAIFDASKAISLENSSSAVICLSLIPERVRIHSSLVSTIFSKSALVRILSGR